MNPHSLCQIWQLNRNLLTLRHYLGDIHTLALFQGYLTYQQMNLQVSLHNHNAI